MPGEDLEALSSGPQKRVERGRQHYRYRSSGDADGLRVLLAIGRVQVARHGLQNSEAGRDSFTASTVPSVTEATASVSKDQVLRRRRER